MHNSGHVGQSTYWYVYGGDATTEWFWLAGRSANLLVVKVGRAPVLERRSRVIGNSFGTTKAKQGMSILSFPAGSQPLRVGDLPGADLLKGMTLTEQATVEIQAGKGGGKNAQEVRWLLPSGDPQAPPPVRPRQHRASTT